MSLTRTERTAVRVLEDRMRRQGHSHPAHAAEYAVRNEIKPPGCRHRRTYQTVQGNLFGGEELLTICADARCNQIVKSVSAA